MSTQARLILIIVLIAAFVLLRPKMRRKIIDGAKNLINPSPGTAAVSRSAEQVEAPQVEDLGGGLERKTIEIGGRDIGYIEGGRGPYRSSVLLLHGFLGDKEQWMPVLGALVRAGCHVVAPDLPGCGQNAKDPEGRYDVTSQAKRLRSFAHRVGCKEMHLVGTSMGATIAGALAYVSRDSVQSLVLIEPFGVRVPYPSELDEMLAKGRNPFFIVTPAAYENLEGFLCAHRPSRDRYQAERVRRIVEDRAVNQKIWQDVREGEHAHILDLLLPELSLKTLVVVGQKSRVVHPSVAEAVPSQMPQARGVVVDGVGHLPHVEKPAEIARLLVEHFEIGDADGPAS